MPVEGRDDEVVPVTFVKHFASYNAGETASFLPEQAQALIDEGVALAGDPATSPPVNLTVPHVGQDGDILSCTMGNWTGEPSAYAYQWQRDGTEDVGDGTDAYTVTADDAGHMIACIVTATNDNGSTAAPPSNGVAVAGEAARE